MSVRVLRRIPMSGLSGCCTVVASDCGEECRVGGAFIGSDNMRALITQKSFFIPPKQSS